ncbi:MAG: PEP-CTERM sorting domain-containing protein [Caldilineaceae bacterium]
MKRSSFSRVGILVALSLIMLVAFAAIPATVMAQDPPSADTPTAEPPTFTPTATTQPTATNTPNAGPTPTGTNSPITATATGVATVTPVPGGPVTIPEPVTVVLFGTGLAALSAAVATRRGKNGKGGK